MASVSTWVRAALDAGTMRGVLRSHAILADGSREAGSAYSVSVKSDRSDGVCGRVRLSDPLRTGGISRQGVSIDEGVSAMSAQGSCCRQPGGANWRREAGMTHYRSAKTSGSITPLLDISFVENPVGKTGALDLVVQCATRHARRGAVICMCDNTAPLGDADMGTFATLQTTERSPIDREEGGVGDGKKGAGDDDDRSSREASTGGGDGGATGGGGGGGHGGGGGDDLPDRESGDGGGDFFGPVLTAKEVQSIVAVQGVDLPDDMATAAVLTGIPALLLSRYIELQGLPWPLGPAIQSSGLLRERMLADPKFLFKVLTEITIDSGCATFAEVKKRGAEFWDEFEFYLSDLLVGIVLDVALVGMLAPIVTFGTVNHSSKGLQGSLSRILSQLPNSVFEAASPGRSFTVNQRVATLFVKGAQYGVAGFLCGVVGQGIANTLMTFKRSLNKGKDGSDVPIPPLLKSAACWALFMGVSSNLRYQMINGMERVVESSVMAKNVPLVAMAFTVGIRFANNIYGGMQFVDLARWAGIQ
ncbi:hypothetical protein CBR_g48677 [Chara braunii]|uniref:Uncharacterized protein n=1 Tax=Chara braunii TaxID=69332 RepID=A0A388K4I9_CHABU|nr:hypothetical protein CBR_g48677 [Chara braunii]|eukprot:GBG64929.1 hypothetical protein CBR_g48677 [Chara braunii]